jgi:hypothetical protein
MRRLQVTRSGLEAVRQAREVLVEFLDGARARLEEA